MNAWSNIEVSNKDPEVMRINQFEKRLGTLPNNICQIRELITRFEVCHFKARQHLYNIKSAITHLQPQINLDSIGMNHIRHGDDAWKNDESQRSRMGQQYIEVIKSWLNDTPNGPSIIIDDEIASKPIHEWLGTKEPAKEHLVRLLLARLTWDWTTYETLLSGSKEENLEYQICRLDICHYAFPSNLDNVLQGIGNMQPASGFEGCGSFNAEARDFLMHEFGLLNEWLKTLIHDEQPDKTELIKTWLIACLCKTIKEQVKLSDLICGFEK
ncbi:MAG: hypothetical protein JEZ14_21140 [Marinilabiliaceae bacterium]|nr:hypothetical protein [Marinilabiliaceae bacterium]